MEMVVKAVPPEVAANLVVPPELEVSVTVSAVVVGLPLTSCSWTVIGPMLAVALADADNAVVVKASLLTAPTLMVSIWVPEVSPLAAAVIVGLPALVSW